MVQERSESVNRKNAGTRNRTTDAGIFSPSLYLLSYPGTFSAYDKLIKLCRQEKTRNRS